MLEKLPSANLIEEVEALLPWNVEVDEFNAYCNKAFTWFSQVVMRDVALQSRLV